MLMQVSYKMKGTQRVADMRGCQTGREGGKYGSGAGSLALLANKTIMRSRPSRLSAGVRDDIDILEIFAFALREWETKPLESLMLVVVKRVCLVGRLTKQNIRSDG